MWLESVNFHGWPYWSTQNVITISFFRKFDLKFETILTLLNYENTAVEPKGFHCGGSLITKDYVLTGEKMIHSQDLYSFRVIHGLKIMKNFSIALYKRKATTATWMANHRFFIQWELNLFKPFKKNLHFDWLTAVRLGEWDQRTDPDCDENNCADKVINVPVVANITHENFQTVGQAEDIALLRLAHSVTFTSWIKPICLPITERARTLNFENYPFIVAGFGKTEVIYNRIGKFFWKSLILIMKICFFSLSEW